MQKHTVQIQGIRSPLGGNGTDRLAPAVIRQRLLIDGVGAILSLAHRINLRKLLMQFGLAGCGRTQCEKENGKKACQGKNAQKTGY